MGIDLTCGACVASDFLGARKFRVLMSGVARNMAKVPYIGRYLLIRLLL